jgi:hypothetical protein
MTALNTWFEAEKFFTLLLKFTFEILHCLLVQFAVFTSLQVVRYEDVT